MIARIVVVMTTGIPVILTTTIARIARAPMSASRREILGSRGLSKSQPLVTIPRNECVQRVYDCGQKPPVAPSRSPKPLFGRGSLLP
jgi:hypothetical protein